MWIVDAFEISWFFATSTAIHTKTYTMPECVAKDVVDFRVYSTLYIGLPKID